MNPSALSIALRPRTLLETCDLSVAFVRRGLGVYLPLWALTLGLPGSALYAAQRWLEVTWPNVWFWVLVWAVLVQGIFTVAGAELLFAHRVSVRRVLARFAASLGPYLLALVASRIAFVLSALTLILLPRGYARCSLISEVVLLEGLRGRDALRRAARLGSMLTRPLTGFGLVALTGFAVAAFLAETLGWALFEFLLQLGSPAGDLFREGGSLCSVLGVLAVVPLLATLRLLAYVDGRAQQDGWDIQLKFQTIRTAEERAA